MKKVSVALLFSVCTLCLLVFPVSVSASMTNNTERQLIIDDANILTVDEKESIESYLRKSSKQENFDITIATVESVGDVSTYDYARVLYNMFDYGTGTDKDGVILLFCSSNNEWDIYVNGYGKTAFTDAGITYLKDKISTEISDGNYKDAFTEYITLCVDYVNKSRNESPYDEGNLPKIDKKIGYLIAGIVSLGIGITLSGLMTATFSRASKKVEFNHDSKSYIKRDGLVISESEDILDTNIR